ncbi:MAG: ArnT family glycosyltransferase [Planctomycetota bacterium]
MAEARGEVGGARRAWRLRVAAGLAVAFLLGAGASTGPGLTWDEPGYVAAGYSYVRWLGSPRVGTIDHYWAINHEHPPAAKLLYGALGALEHESGLLAVLTARLGAAMLFTVLAGLTYLFTARYYGRTAGALAGLSLVLMPRVFGHGHLAALDAPVALACLAATLVFARIESGWKWGAFAGALWGVALLTKVNAIFLPAVLVPWAAWVLGRKAAAPCLAFVAAGVLVFFAGWPWLWPRPVERAGNYALNKTERLSGDMTRRPAGTTAVPVHYLGRTYRERPAPWHYPLVLTLVTVPVGLLVFAGLGCGAAWRGRKEIAVLIGASGWIHLLVFVVPSVPKYDGVRLFLPAFPFLACLAGVGAARVWRWRGRVGRVIVCAALLLAAGVLAWTHPYELSYYNALAGGARGARALGFETTYWGDVINPGVMADVNRVCPKGSAVAVWPPYQHITQGGQAALPWMARELRWDKDWSPGRPLPDFLLVFQRQGYLGPDVERVIRRGTLVKQWTYMGVSQARLIRFR